MTRSKKRSGAREVATNAKEATCATCEKQGSKSPKLSTVLGEQTVFCSLIKSRKKELPRRRDEIQYIKKMAKSKNSPVFQAPRA
jgi:hypothetical protein